MRCEWFVLSSGYILLLAGAAKVVSILGSARLLDQPDALTGIRLRVLLAVVGGVELVTGMVIVIARKRTIAVGLIAWMAGCFVSYRVGLWLVGGKKPCPCLGNLTDALRIPPDLADMLIRVVLAYLLVGSYAVLLSRLRQQKPISSGVGKSTASVPNH